MKSSTFLFISLILPLTYKVGMSEPLFMIMSAIGSALVAYFSTRSAVVLDGLHRTYEYIGQKIGVFEGCEDHWIPANMHDLEYDLRANVFGQPIALDMILSALKYHLYNPNPEKPLMLSFHGTPGTGKNFISQKILTHMFYKGAKTKYVKFFRGSIDFPSTSQSSFVKYQDLIVDEVKKMVYQCHRSVIVFDEVDKMPSGLLNVLSAFVKVGQFRDFDFRRVIFILLSNIGESGLLSHALYSYKNNIEREEMSQKDLSEMLANHAFNSKGGLQKTGLIKNMSITHYVPFLPLDRTHITQCLAKEVAKMGQIPSLEMTNQVLAELTYMPKPDNIFAYGGCKGVGEKALFLIQRLVSKKLKESNKLG